MRTDDQIIRCILQVFGKRKKTYGKEKKKYIREKRKKIGSCDFWFSCAYSYANTHMMAVVVRQTMWGTCVEWNPAYLYHWRTLEEVENTKQWNVETVCINVNLSDFRVAVVSQIHMVWKWFSVRICVGCLCGLDSGISLSLKDVDGSWEHKNSC